MADKQLPPGDIRRCFSITMNLMQKKKRRSSVKLLTCYDSGYSIAMNRITWFWVVQRHYKRFNRDTAHTTKCSCFTSQQPWSSCHTQTEKQGGNKRGGRKTLTSPWGPTLSVLSMSRQMGEAETRLCTTNRHQPILGSLVSLGICRVPVSVMLWICLILDCAHWLHRFRQDYVRQSLTSIAWFWLFAWSIFYNKTMFSVIFSWNVILPYTPKSQVLPMKRERESVSIYTWLSWESNLPHDSWTISQYSV